MSKHHAPRPAQKRKGKPKPKVVKEDLKLLSPGSGYVKDPKYGLGKDSRHTTDPDYLIGDEDDGTVREPEPEAVDDETQEWITKEAENRRAILRAEDDRRREVRSLAAQVREVGSLALQRGVDLPELERIRAELAAARKRLTKAA